MNDISNFKVITVTLVGTAVFYVVFALLVNLQPLMLSSFADPAYPLLSKLLLPIWRGTAEMFVIGGVALAIYLAYRLLTRSDWFRSRRISSGRAGRGQVLRETLLNANLALAGGLQGMAYIVISAIRGSTPRSTKEAGPTPPSAC